ncbi:MAG: DNA translocase FtsK [Wenzhouxiangellaceae bacterium]
MPNPLAARLYESLFVLLVISAVYLLICLWTFHPDDPGFSHTGSGQVVRNRGGAVGAWLADFLLSLFGLLGYVFPLLLLYLGWRQLPDREPRQAPWLEVVVAVAGFVLVLLAGSALLQLHAAPSSAHLPAGIGGGGIIGAVISSSLTGALSPVGTTLLMLALLLAGITLYTGLSWLGLMDWLGRWTLQLIESGRKFVHQATDTWAGRRARAERDQVRRIDHERQSRREPVRIEPRVEEPQPKQPDKPKVRQQPLFKNLPTKGGKPSFELLDEPRQTSKGYSKEELEVLSRQVELKLADFGVQVEVEAVHPGPVITRFELLPAAGVKVSQISSLAKDLARGLSVISVRVVDVIPGKSVIGLEIPNQNREIVFLREVLESQAYQRSNSPLTLGLGKGISGKPVVADVARMPHLLVAGTTGSGKSVAVNAMILSILFKATPDQVRLILIDPKMLELSVYEGIPHLLAPVVTDMKEAGYALRWCVAEMERRYKLMANVGVRNLAGFNRRVQEAKAEGKPLKDPFFDAQAAGPGAEAEELEPLPFIVVVVDEFADMMMIVGKKVEELIARLAQKARASGIHLILATQRPSVDVITGLIKANIPTRIAFQVSSRIDSRTILDQSGAEQLLGHGDMLYLPPGSALPERVHGAFVDDHEVHQVVESLRASGEPNYIDEVLQETQTTSDGQVIGATGLPESPDGEKDEFYDRAVQFVLESRRASISSVQRHLRIGYNRAARMIEEMEQAGVVSAPEHNGQREVLVPAPPKD